MKKKIKVSSIIKWGIIMMLPIMLHAIAFLPKRGIEQTEATLCISALNGTTGDNIAQQTLSSAKNSIGTVFMFGTILYYSCVGIYIYNKKTKGKV